MTTYTDGPMVSDRVREMVLEHRALDGIRDGIIAKRAVDLTDEDMTTLDALARQKAAISVRIVGALDAAVFMHDAAAARSGR